MKHLKAKLMMSVISLMLATIMMTTASFAWFTISTAPEVSNLTTKMTANANLEIMLDNGYTNADAAGAAATTLGPTDTATTAAARNVYWGNLVDLTSFFGADGSLKDLVLKPVSATEANGAITFKTPTFGLDGRITGETALSARTADKGVVLYGTDQTVANCYAAEIDLWLRTNTEGVTVNLGTAAHRGDGSDDEEGLGSWITNDKITVKISDGTTVFTATHGALNGGKYPLTLTDGAATPTAKTIALTKDVAKKITVYVYMDGATLTNADFATEVKDVMLNLQFVDSTGTVVASKALQVNESSYGRTSVSVPAAYPGSSSTT